VTRPHRVFLDALDAGLARLVLTDGETAFTLPRALLPAGAKEGDWLAFWIERRPPQKTARKRKGQ
jgi:hypothetical protein